MTCALSSVKCVLFFLEFQACSEVVKYVLFGSINVLFPSWPCCEGGIPAEVLFIQKKLWEGGLLSALEAWGLPSILVVTGPLGSRGRWVLTSSVGTRAEGPSFLCSRVSTGKIMHQCCCDTRLEDYEPFLHALMISLMKGKRFNEEEKNLLRILCLYLLLKAEYLLTVVVVCDSRKARNNHD